MPPRAIGALMLTLAALCLITWPRGEWAAIRRATDTATRELVEFDSAPFSDGLDRQSYGAYDARQVRAITVTVAVDEEFARSKDWRTTVRDDIQFANERFASFGVRFVLQDVGELRTLGPASTIQELYNGVNQMESVKHTDIAVVMSGRELPESSVGHAPDIGLAELFGSVVLVRCAPESAQSRYRRGTLLHELGHLFGAWHTADEHSIMRSHAESNEALNFDSDAADMIRRFRLRDFSRGAEGLTEADITDVSKRFRERHIPGEVHPIASALCGLSCRMWRRGDVLSAEMMIESAIRLSEELEGIEGRNTIVLRGLLSELRRTGRWPDGVRLYSRIRCQQWH